MASSDNQDYSKVLGIPPDDDKPQGSLKVTPDTTAWEVYNYHAQRGDTETVKDWTDSLNFLLVFAGLYSGVLTAFIMSSMQLLQEASSDVTRDILLHISRQLAVTSTAAFDPPSGPFVPPEWAVRVNYCFFFSLSCSLITALAAVLALQWVSSYDHGLNPSSAKGLALQRQFRMEGAKRWKLEHIIGTIPTIIFISLLIFFVGLAEWLWNIHHNVAIIIMVGASVGALFYVATTLVSILSIGAPFRTPTSRYLPLWIGTISRSISNLFTYTRAEPITVNTVITSIGATMSTLHTDARIHVTERTNIVPTTHRVRDQPRWKQFLTGILKPISPLYSIKPYETREQKAVDANKDIELSSLFWAARSISIEPYNRPTLRLIMQAILEQPEWERHNDPIDGELWIFIFTELYAPYAGKENWVDYSSEDLKDASLFVRGLCSIGQGLLNDFEFHKLVGKFYGSYPSHGIMCHRMKQWKKLALESEQKKPSPENSDEWKRKRHSRHYNIDFNQPGQEGPGNLSHRIINEIAADSVDHYPQHYHDEILSNLDTALSSKDRFPLEFIMATLHQVKGDPKKLALMTIQEMFKKVNKHLHIERNRVGSTRPLPLPVLDLVQEIITTRISGTFVASLDPVAYSDTVARYVNKMKNEKEEQAWKSAVLAHEVIMEQTIANLIQIDALDVSNGPRIQEVLAKLDQLAQCGFGHSKDIVRSALSSMLNTEIDIWSHNNRIYTAKSILSLLQVNNSNFNGQNWAVWWAEILLAFGGLIHEDKDAESIVIKHCRQALLAQLPHRGQFSDYQITNLSAIPHLGIRLSATAVTQSMDLVNSFFPNDSRQKLDAIWFPSDAWMEFIDTCFDQLNTRSSGNDLFLRAFAVGSSAGLYNRIYEQSISHYLNSPSDLIKYLSYPMLYVVLRHAESRPTESMKLLDTIAKDAAFSTEFLKSNGFEWLPKFVRQNPVSFDVVIGIIYAAISKCQGAGLAILWIQTTLKCQEAITLVIPTLDGRLSINISENANTLMDHLKARRATGLVPQDGRRIAPNDAQERLPAVIQDDPKSNEWTVSNKEKWATQVDRVITGFEDLRDLIAAPTSYDEAYTLPSNDIAFLRKLTLVGPDNSYRYMYSILGDIIASTTMSLEYFHTPVLDKIMRMDEDFIFEIIKTLIGISRYTWFTGEFIRADGSQLLPLRLRTLYLEETIEMATNSLSVVTAYNDTLLWLRLVYSCLNSVGLKLEGSDPDKVSMLAYASSNLDELANRLRKMKWKWQEDRENQPSDKAPGDDNTNEGDVKSNATLWSLGEWEDIDEIVDELLDGGLKRGYIMPAPSAEHHRFIRDPDGLCLHSRPQRVNIPSTRMKLMRVPRDPDGICASAPTFCG